MKSSDLRQSAEYKRKAIHVQVLPTAVDFGEDIPYPIILSNWDDPNTGDQYVFSTYNGTDVKHWIGVGVNSTNGTLSAWQPDGSYKRVPLEDFSEPDTKFVVNTGVMPGTDDSLTVNHGVAASDILSATLLVEYTSGQWIDPSITTLSGTDVSLLHTGTSTQISLPENDSWRLTAENFKLTLVVNR